MNCFWGHKFGRWEIWKEEAIQDAANKARVGYSIIQMRLCARCNFREFNERVVVL